MTIKEILSSTFDILEVPRCSDGETTVIVDIWEHLNSYDPNPEYPLEWRMEFTRHRGDKIKLARTRGNEIQVVKYGHPRRYKKATKKQEKEVQLRMDEFYHKLDGIRRKKLISPIELADTSLFINMILKNIFLMPRPTVGGPTINQNGGDNRFCR